MKKFSISLLCGLAAMVLTVILYFLILQNILLQVIHFVALVAILLAEGITTFYACSTKGNPRKVAVALFSAIMVPFAIILSVVYIVNFPTGYGAYIGWYCAGAIVVNVIAYILLRFDSSKRAENDTLQNAKENMLGLRKIVKCIMADPAAQAYDKQIRALEEKLHFSNDNVIVEEDENIREMLLQLQKNIEDAEYDADSQIKKIGKAIDLRNILTSRNA